MAYVTVSEVEQYVRSHEAIEQSTEDVGPWIDVAFYEKMIEIASAFLDSRLGVRYALPLPFSAHVKALCYPKIIWWAEKHGGEKREWVNVENEAVDAEIDRIVAGKAVLLGIDGQPHPIALPEETPIADGFDYGLDEGLSCWSF